MLTSITYARRKGTPVRKPKSGERMLAETPRRLNICTSHTGELEKFQKKTIARPRIFHYNYGASRISCRMSPEREGRQAGQDFRYPELSKGVCRAGQVNGFGSARVAG